MYINSRYTIYNHKLGSGSYSEVFSGYDNEMKRKIAIKKISLQNKRIVVTKIIKEVEIMKNFDHCNIVKYYNIVSTCDYYYIIMEYCDAGTLYDYIYDNKMTISATNNIEHKSFYFLIQLKNALSYMREKGYIHRDIKPMNILLSKIDNRLVVKLADFGLARYYKENDNILLNTVCGTPLYMAPELFSSYEYNYKADLWSYGIVMYEILFKKHPLVSITLTQLFNDIKSKTIDFNENYNYTALCFNLLKALLIKDSENRIEWDVFNKHPWFEYWENQTLSETNLFINNNLQNCLTENNDYVAHLPPSKILSTSNLTKMTILKTNKLNKLDFSDIPSSYPIRGVLCDETKTTFSIDNPDNISLSCDSNILNRESLDLFNSTSDLTSSASSDESELNEFIFLENKKQSFPIDIKKCDEHNYIKNAISYITSPLSYYSSSLTKSFSK